MSTLQWVACSATTGVVITDLPGLSVDRIADAMNGYETASGTLTLDANTSAEWLNATRPGSVYMVLLEDGLPVWGGLVARRTRGKGNAVNIDMGTIPTYWRRRFVGDVTYTSTDQCAIVEALVVAYGDASGLPFAYDVSVSATHRDRTYLDINDKSLFSVMSELAAVDGGPEWMVGWVATTVGTQTAYVPQLIVRDRLGTTPNAGMDPAVTWEYPGDITDFTLIEDYGDGSGANDVLALSSAANDARPQSAHALVTGDNRPKFEMRFTPSTSISVTATLDSHAVSKSALVGQGSRSLAVSLIGSTARPGIDFQMGDVTGFNIGGSSSVTAVTADRLLAYPGGLGGTGRVIGWSRTLTGVQQVTPVLADLVVTRGRW